MFTQISFTADKDLKAKTMQKVKDKGITLKSLLIFSMDAFVDGKIKIGILAKPEDEIEELHFEDSSINKKAKKLAQLLK
jgi:purine-nucleoside phosphorylase